MSSLRRVIAVVSASTVLAAVSLSVAAAGPPPPPGSGTDVGKVDSTNTDPKLCNAKPKKPDYPLMAGSAKCCKKPAYWQVFTSGGLDNKSPLKHWWNCAPTPPTPK